MTGNFAQTLTGSRTITDVNIREVFNKIEDDFWAIRTRGFTSINFDWLEKNFEDILYVALKRELKVAELQFNADGKKWIVRYEIDETGSIQRDQDSGGIRFRSVPSGATMNTVILRHTKTTETNDYLSKRGWGNNGTLYGEDGEEDRTFSSKGYGATRKLSGQW